MCGHNGSWTMATRRQGRDEGESNQLLGRNRGRDWAVPELPESLEPGWIGVACKRWMAFPWITHIRLKEHLGRKMVRGNTRVCTLTPFFPLSSCRSLRTTSAQVDNLAHLGSKSEFIEKVQMQEENVVFGINHSKKQHGLSFEGRRWCYFMF